jgi:hypothetical protein
VHAPPNFSVALLFYKSGNISKTRLKGARVTKLLSKFVHLDTDAYVLPSNLITDCANIRPGRVVVLYSPKLYYGLMHTAAVIVVETKIDGGYFLAADIDMVSGDWFTECLYYNTYGISTKPGSAKLIQDPAEYLYEVPGFDQGQLLLDIKSVLVNTSYPIFSND